ncbi:biopolymer transporter [bacterium]|nr:biopolymer transporter [bacterium]
MLRRETDEEVEQHIDMTPMVDVVFQLMTFLLLSSQMTGGEIVNVPPAVHGVGVQKDASALVIILPPSEAGGASQILMGEDLNAPRAEDDESIRKYLTSAVASGRSRVIIQADGQVDHGEVLRVAAVVGEVEGTSLHIAVQEPPSK